MWLQREVYEKDFLKSLQRDLLASAGLSKKDVQNYVGTKPEEDNAAETSNNESPLQQKLNQDIEI